MLRAASTHPHRNQENRGWRSFFRQPPASDLENAGHPELASLARMLDQVPVNVMFVDHDLIMRYMNQESESTLRQFQHLLPIPVDRMIGTCIDVFHKDPAVQRSLLANPAKLPYHGLVPLGPEIMDLHVKLVFDEAGRSIGAMATWSIVTESENLKRTNREHGESLATSTSQITQAIGEISVNVHSCSALSSRLDESFAQTQNMLEQLSDKSRSIEEVVSLIQNTAEKTKLLALNATIEAARAGEHGKGFSIVASEVKQLSTTTAESTSRIRERIEAIRESIAGVVEAATNIADSVRILRSNTGSIAAAVEEQSVTMNELSQLANQLLNTRPTSGRHPARSTASRTASH